MRVVEGILAKMINEGIVHAEDGYYRVVKEKLETVALSRYLGVKKNDKSMEAIVEKTEEMNIETEEAVRSNKRGREDQEDYGTYDEGRRQSKRIKKSKVTNDYYYY